MKNISLYYTGGGSDKVYHAQIVEDDGLFRVNFQFGRRGAHLAEGTKTREPVAEADAVKIFDRLVAEKMAKGYTEGLAGTPYGGDAAKLADVLPHPRKLLATREESRAWTAEQYLIQRKYDGELARVRICPSGVANSTPRGKGAVVLAEFMRPKSGGFFTAADHAMHARFPLGWWAAFTVEELHGENVLHESTAWRWGCLGKLAPMFAPDMVLAEVVADVDAAFAGGAEGVVGHAWDAPWGDMVAVKQGGVWTCRVTSVGSTQSVGIEIVQSPESTVGSPAGRVKLGGGKVDRVRVGSIIRVEGMGLTDAGKIRQPVACREWLVKF